MLQTTVGGRPDQVDDHSSSIGTFKEDGPAKHFIENLGQLNDESILYYTESDPSVLVRNGSISLLTLQRSGSSTRTHQELRLEFTGSRPVKVHGAVPTGTYHNFYLSEDEGNWVELARSFERVEMVGAYPGISIVILLEDGWPKYELHCEPCSDPSVVSVTYHGIASLNVADSKLLSIEAFGTILTEGPLVAYQGTNVVPCSYMTSGNTVKFEMGHYDPLRTLIIDPLLAAATYVGGNSWDKNPFMKRGPSGDIFLVGNVESYDLYTHPGSADHTHGGERDIYICRMGADLSSMSFATYLGGTLYDDPAGISLDAQDNIIVSGLTNSSDLPTTASAYDRSYNGGGSDAFISSFDATLGTLRFSTYIGGSGKDLSRGTACTSKGEPLIVGMTYSGDLPGTIGNYQSSLKGDWDIFLLKLGPDGKAVLNCTYLGGSSYGEFPYAIEIDPYDRPIIAGMMLSNDYPTTTGAFQTHFGFSMGFVTQLDSNLRSLVFSTFFGNGTWIRDIELDPSGNVYMTGRTVLGAGHFPVTPGAYDTTFTGEEDAFIARLSYDGSKVDFASFLGADENYGGKPNYDYYEGGLGVTILPDGRPVVCGYTDSTFFPLSPDAFDKTRSEQDAFLTIFSKDCGAIDYSTFIGGSDEDSGTSVIFSPPNTLYLAGETYSNYPSHDFPVTSGTYDTTFSVGYDMFIARFKLDSFLPGPPRNVKADWGDNLINLSWDMPLDDGGEPILGFRVYKGLGPRPKTLLFETKTNFSYLDTNVTNGVRYHYGIRALNSVGEGASSEVSAVPMTKPGPPIPLSVRASDRSLNFTFAPPLDKGGAPTITYNVFISNGSGPYEKTASNISRSYLNISGLMNGRSYDIRASAVNLAGEGPMSGPVQGVPRKRPGIPRSLLVRPLPNGAVLTWAPPEDTGGAWNLTYRVYGGTTPNATSLMASDLNVTIHEMISLENGRDHHFFVAAVNEMGEGKMAGPVTTAPLGVPSEPWDLKAEEFGDHIVVRWNAPNSTGGYSNLTYELRYCVENIYGVITLNRSIDRERTVWGVRQGLVHTFYVRAYNSRFYGPWSTNASVIPYLPPGPPLDLISFPGDGRLKISWEVPIENGGDPDLSYELYMGESESSIYLKTRTENRSVVLSGLVNGRTYLFKVRAVNIKGPGPFSKIAAGTPMRAPSKPESLRCAIGDARLDITWERPGDDGGDPKLTYDVLFGVKDQVQTFIGTGMVERSLTIDGLVNGLTYMVTVNAKNSMGSSPSVSTYGTPMTLPRPPASLNATWERSIITVKWSPPLDDGGGDIWLYHIYKSMGNEPLKEVAKVDSSSRYWTDQDVEKGITYRYSVRAENPLGLGPAAGPVEAKAPVTPKKALDIPWAYIGVGGLILFLVTFIIIMFVLSRNDKRRVWEE